jgi:hypothetical protein
MEKQGFLLTINEGRFLKILEADGEFQLANIFKKWIKVNRVNRVMLTTRPNEPWPAKLKICTNLNFFT